MDAGARLTPGERKLAATVRGKTMSSWLASRVVIKELAARKQPGILPASIETCRKVDGPPCCLFPDGRSIPVSVAHDDYYVIAAFSRAGTLVGVDLEPVSDRVCRVISRFFGGLGEVEPLLATRLWTGCEAVAKCSRTPLLRVLRTARFAVGGPESLTIELPGLPPYLVKQILFENRVLSATSSTIT